MNNFSLDNIPLPCLVIDNSGLIIEISDLINKDNQLNKMKLNDNLNNFLNEPYSENINLYYINDNKVSIHSSKLKNSNSLLIFYTTTICSDKFKEILNNISKEIIEPLSGIIGIIPLLSDTENIDKYIKVLTDTSYGLMRSINNIIDYSMLNSNKITVNNEKFNIEDSIISTVQILAFKAFIKKIKIKIDIHPSIKSISCIGDSKKIQQILIILLSNSIKYTPENKDIIISVEKMENDPFTLLYTVSDTGIGIPSDRSKLLFDESINKSYIGLAVCKKLCELMNGSIWLKKTVVGKGTTFCFKIKIEYTDNVTVLDDMSLLSLKGIKVLVVDDNETTRVNISKILLKYSMIPFIFSTHSEALLFINSGISFDLAILNIHSDKIDGIGLATKLNNTPVIALSDMGDSLSSGKKLFECLIIKPVKSQILIRECSKILSKEYISVKKNCNIQVLIYESFSINRFILVTHLKRLGITDIKEVKTISEIKKEIFSSNYDLCFINAKSREVQIVLSCISRNLNELPYFVSTNETIETYCSDNIEKPFIFQKLKAVIQRYNLHNKIINNCV
jgi:CheY-like chemotaxis protein